MNARPLALLFIAGLATTALADSHADATAHFDRGERLYNLGKFDQAITEFEAAYELEPDPAYLFNLAQAWRLAGSVERALFFYRRYIELRPDAPNRAVVEQRIAQLEAEQTVATDKAAADKAAADKAAADKAAADKAAADKAAADKAAADKAAADKGAAAVSPHRFRLTISVGWSNIYLNGLDYEVAPQLTERTEVAYLFHRGAWTFDAGVLLQLTTIPFQTTSARHVNFIQVHVLGAISRRLTRVLGARLGIGLGRTSLSNLDTGNPLTAGGEGGSQRTMWVVRSDLYAMFRISSQRPTVDVLFGPSGISFSGPASSLGSDLDRIITLEGLYLGVEATF